MREHRQSAYLSACPGLWQLANGLSQGAYFLCMQLLARTYHQGIHVSTEEIENLRRIATIAQHKKQSLIFLPCHRSHVDYVSLQVLCYRLGIALPVVVAGENLNFPVVGPFLQHAGAMFIRRSFGGDELYTSTVQGYVDVLLKGGYNFECFIEGTRSRTGKLLPPKFGILGFVLDSLLSGRVDDAWVIPVSTQYDKVIETEAYVNELLGLPKPKENLWDFLGSSKYLSLKMGRVDVRFHDPWSLRSFIDDFQSKQAPGMSVTTQYPPEQRLKLLRSLGYRVLGDINKVSVVMPTSLIGTVLLTLRGRGVGKSELVRRMEWLSSRIRAKGGRVAHFGGVGVSTVVDRGLEVLGDLVGRVEGLAEETFYAVDRFQLSFYRNMVIHLFISECLVAAAMYTRIKQGGGPANQRVPYATLLTQVSFLSQLFRGEFVFPTTGLTANLRTTIEGLRADGVIEVGPDAAYVELSDAERRCGRENYDFYCFLIWPFIESSWLAGVATIALTPPPPPRRRPTIDYPSSSSTNTSAAEEEGWVGVKEAQEMTQLLGKTLYHQGDVSYFESVNKQSIGSSFQRFQEDGILESSRKASPSGTPMLRLAEQWRPARDPATGNIVHQGRLWEYVERIAVSRREGKNRRDSASVGSRVLKLAQELGQDLFERAAEKRREDAEKASAAEDRAKRERAML